MSRHPFTWPSDLYLELKYMGQALFMADVFDSLVQVARTQIVEGLAVDEDGRVLMRQVTAEQATHMLRENADILTDDAALGFSKKFNLGQVAQQLEAVQHAAPGSKSCVGWDDDDGPSKNLTYVVIKDDAGKRLTVVWLNAGTIPWWDGAQQHVSIPSQPDEKVGVHRGTYQFLFGSGGGEKKTKFDHLCQTLKPLWKAYPKYKLYVTGLDAGAAVAQLSAFFLAQETSWVPPPVSCLVFGAPRVGDSDGFLAASQALEQQRRWRVCRVVHPSDGQAYAPLFGFGHVGFQLTLDPTQPPRGQKKPQKTLSSSIQWTYPKISDECGVRFLRMLDNRGPPIWAQKKVTLEEYRQVLDACTASVQALDLNESYADAKVTGYDIAPMPVEK